MIENALSGLYICIIILLYTRNERAKQAHSFQAYLTRNFILFKSSHSPVRAHLDPYMRMHSSVLLGAHAHPG